MSQYNIGSDHWPGLSKLIEEAGEVAQVCGKIMGTGGQSLHWDGSLLRDRLEEEMADLKAALIFVVRHNELDSKKMDQRAAAKLTMFEKWHRDGDPPP